MIIFQRLDCLGVFFAVNARKLVRCSFRFLLISYGLDFMMTRENYRPKITPQLTADQYNPSWSFRETGQCWRLCASCWASAGGRATISASDCRNHGALPLPVGKRVGVRGPRTHVRATPLARRTEPVIGPAQAGRTRWCADLSPWERLSRERRNLNHKQLRSNKARAAPARAIRGRKSRRRGGPD